MKIISTPNAPSAIGPYSQAVSDNANIFCSGQIGLDPKTGLIEEGIEAQTKQTLVNLQAVLVAAESDFDHVLSTTIYLTNMDHFQIVNQIYATFFTNHKPARATVEVKGLPKGALIEISAIATKK